MELRRASPGGCPNANADWVALTSFYCRGSELGGRGQGSSAFVMLHLRAGHENRPWDNDTGRHLYVPTRSGLIRQVNSTPRAKCCRYRCASFLFRRTMRAVFVCCRSSCALGSLVARHQGRSKSNFTIRSTCELDHIGHLPLWS
jgi:hypothetical protein